MISRVAEHCFWMARYLERAEKEIPNQTRLAEIVERFAQPSTGLALQRQRRGEEAELGDFIAIRQGLQSVRDGRADGAG